MFNSQGSSQGDPFAGENFKELILSLKLEKLKK